MDWKFTSYYEEAEYANESLNERESIWLMSSGVEQLTVSIILELDIRPDETINIAESTVWFYPYMLIFFLVLYNIWSVLPRF